MAGTVVAVFKDRIQAERAADALLNAGISINDISLVHRDAGGEHGSRTDMTQPPDKEEEFLSHSVREVRTHDVEEPGDRKGDVLPLMYTWGFMGGSFGCMFVGMLVYFPYSMGIITEHPLGTQLIGCGIGAVIGGIIGAMSAGEMPNRQASSFHEHVQRGNALVAVLTAQAKAASIEEILRAQGGSEIEYFSRIIDTFQRVES